MKRHHSFRVLKGSTPRPSERMNSLSVHPFLVNRVASLKKLRLRYVPGSKWADISKGEEDFVKFIYENKGNL